MLSSREYSTQDFIFLWWQGHCHVSRYSTSMYFNAIMATGLFVRAQNCSSSVSWALQVEAYGVCLLSWCTPQARVIRTSVHSIPFSLHYSWSSVSQEGNFGACRLENQTSGGICKRRWMPGAMDYACNPSCLGDIGWRIVVLGQPQAKKSTGPYLKNN
jgi:hypothetical protein